MSFTNYLEQKVLEHFLSTPTVAKPTVYVGLLTAPMSEAGVSTEVTGGSYTRRLWAGTVSGSSPTQVANTSDIVFPTATASWGTVTHVALYDSLTGGNALVYATLDISRIIDSGTTSTFLAGQLKFTLE